MGNRSCVAIFIVICAIFVSCASNLPDPEKSIETLPLTIDVSEFMLLFSA